MSKRASRRIVHVLAAAGVSAVFLVSGCTLQDAVCSDGDYPVKRIGATEGSQCVPEKQEPPAGYVRYPEGKVPKHVDDEWDKYWSDKAIDSNGNLIKG
jgi:hypothetical protein